MRLIAFERGTGNYIDSLTTDSMEAVRHFYSDFRGCDIETDGEAYEVEE